MEQRYITGREVAKLTGLSVSTLNKARSWKTGAAAGLIYSKIGRSVRYAIADVEAFMAGCRVDSGTGQAAVK